MKTFPDIDRLKATLDQHRPLDPAIMRNPEPFIWQVSRIVKGRFHPYFHAWGLAWEETPESMTPKLLERLGVSNPASLDQHRRNA